MIKLFNDPFTEIKFKITIFPDKTSQVWQIEPFEQIACKLFDIEWTFESESEIMQVLQLATLLKHDYPMYTILLHMPYLPYARQDKNIANDATFALTVFKYVIINSDLFDSVHVDDAHNPKAIPEFCNIMHGVRDRLNSIVADEKIDTICFPDEGASNRNYPTFNKPIVLLEKKRNQLTGEIEGLQYKVQPLTLKDKTVLLVDDLCDRGGTFMGAAKLLKDNGASKVILYTTHGIYSGGVQLILDNGLDMIYNLNGRVYGNDRS